MRARGGRLIRKNSSKMLPAAATPSLNGLDQQTIVSVSVKINIDN